ncbi:MAG: TlpA family protein disulfide reductase [Lewinellaceae bacterium]|nr:TlpA family protein disulfide reductase [Lewinellaceae bacterium]
MRDIRHKAYQQEQQWLNAENTVDENALLEHEDAVLRFRTPLMTFADSSAYFWSALLATRWVSPESDFERVPEFMFRQCEKWRAKVGENQWTVQLCQAGNREKLPVLTGDVIPDFPLPMLTGDTIQLQTLLGSRLTILDIWASWCAPCRRENREVLSPLWGSTRTEGFKFLVIPLTAARQPGKQPLPKTWPPGPMLLTSAEMQPLSSKPCGSPPFQPILSWMQKGKSWQKTCTARL